MKKSSIRKRVCPTCKEEKDVSEFNSQLKYCKKCHNVRNMAWKNNNLTKYRESQMKHDIKRSDPNYKGIRKGYDFKDLPIIELRRKLKVYYRLYKYLQDNPCVDCGETNPVILEFDHVRGIKKFNISDAITSRIPWSEIKEEINKCEVRCSNCHRLKTAKDYGYTMYLISKALSEDGDLRRELESVLNIKVTGCQGT